MLNAALVGSSPLKALLGIIWADFSTERNYRDREKMPRRMKAKYVKITTLPRDTG